MNYFANCQTIDQAKNQFKNLCKKLHPDTSGRDSAAEFIEMYAQFKKFRPTQQTEQEKETFHTFNHEQFYDLVKNFDNLENINVSFVGSFVWLEDLIYGATYHQREQIKDINIIGYNKARFASAKKAWYFSPEDYKQKGRTNNSLEELKNKYGCRSFQPSKFQTLK